MQHDGLFIVLEGIDGTGKTTQRAMLRERLDKLGYEVAIFDFPRYGNASGYFVKQYLNGEYGSLEQVGPYTAALFYTLDRYDAASEIKKAILQGKIVIADRFVGSNMAHQGAKINHPEERRGFFLWLDTLEFRMMNIPRPDRSIVLELPADQAQVRVDQKQQRAYTNKTRDLHEASLEHLRQTANAYHDLCQLFPRDFIGIDCFRNNTQLTVEQIGEIIWDKIEPLLPTLPPKPADVPTVSAEPEEQTPPTKRASLLAAAANNAVTLPVASGLEVPTFYTPVYFDAKTKQTYVEQMTKLYQAHSSIAGKLKAFAPNGQALPEQTIRDLAQLTLPVATIVPVKADARELQPSPKTNDKRPAYLEAATELQKNYSDESERANLVSYWPRNEMDLVPAVLYEGSNQSLGEIQRAVSTWPYDKKVAIIHSYIADPNDDKRALDSVTYAWDILAEFQALASLAVRTVEWQLLSPRLGYDVPEIIEQAGLADDFERCYDLSLELYSTLQAAGYTEEAQYATLLGHRVRAKVTASAYDLLQLYRSGADNKLAEMLAAKVAEVHPLVAGSLIQTQNTTEPTDNNSPTKTPTVKPKTKKRIAKPDLDK